MQGLHPQQQQLAALLSVALPKDDSSSPSPSEDDDSSRLAALNSLHRAILYPPNSVLVAHSSSFLSQGFSQLLSDKSVSVRQLAAIAYGSLCSVVCSSPLASNGRQGHVITGGVVDRFLSWALPLVRDVSVGNGAAELALAALHEFLNIGDASRIEPYILPILKTCQELLEDERTSLNLLHRLLGILALISLKFGQCFLPHFVDIVDLLLGWALVPDLSESDRSIIIDTFLKFQKHWLNNVQFSLGLLSKFLGDMEVLLHDGSIGTAQQLRRLLALLSCFLAVLQVTASGMLEMNQLEQICEPLSLMLPRLLTSLSLVGKKFGWSKWVRESWRCLILLAEIMREKFSSFYPLAVDLLFCSLCEDAPASGLGFSKVPSIQVHGVLKTNLQLLSLLKLSLLPSSVQKILQFHSPLSQLRLHPNHLVTGCSAATYLFLLQHSCKEVVGQAIVSLTEELELLRSMLMKSWNSRNGVDNKCNANLGSGQCYSDIELLALIKFDLKILLTCVCPGTDGSLLDQMDVAPSRYERSVKLASFIFEKMNLFESPIGDFLELQVHVMRTLHKLSEVEFSTKFIITKNSQKKDSVDLDHERQNEADSNGWHSIVIIDYLRKYSLYIVSALRASLPLAVKLEALLWICSFCRAVITINNDLNLTHHSWEACKSVSISDSLLFSVLEAASDRELKVRSHVASALELLLQARLINPGDFYTVSEVVLEKLGDPNASVKNAFVRLLSFALPVTVYACGAFDDNGSCLGGHGLVRLDNRTYLQWKRVLALRQLPRQFHSQQLVSVLSYISQRLKVPLSSWIQRLVFSCSIKNDLVSSNQEDTGTLGTNGLWMDIKPDGAMLDKVCSVNNLAAAWWAIHEAARHCINVRLRTNLGGPTQTFAALERMLLDIAHVLQLDTEQHEVNLNLGAASVHLLPMRLLLDFVEALKKNVYNAYEGSSVLPSVARQSALFFRANKKVCEEWFARICEPMMNAGLALQCHAATVHYCAIHMQDLRNSVASALKDKPRTQVAEYIHNLRAQFAGDILRVLRHMALALCWSHEPESLIGLQKWVTMTFSSLFMEDTQLITGHTGSSRPFSWITGLVYQAQGQYERAAAHFYQLLQSEDALSSMGSEGVQFAIERVIESYTALSDWKSLETWLSELQSLRAKHAGKSYSGALTTAGNEINAIHALARFDEGDVQAAWGFLDLTPKSSNELTLEPKLALQRSEQMLLQAMLRKADGNVNRVAEDIENAKLMLEEALSVISLDGLTEAAAYATQLHCIFAFEEGFKLNGQDESHESKQLSVILSSLDQVVQCPINRIHQDCNLWLKILRVYRIMLPKSPVTLQLCQRLIGLARKQKNFMMAHRLTQYLRTNLGELHAGKYTDLLLKNVQYESILLAYAEGKHEDALANLWSLVHTYMLSPMIADADADSMLKAKACLKLSTWLRQKHLINNLENILLKMHTDLVDLRTPNAFSLSRSGDLVSDPNCSLIIEEIVGMSTKLSTHLCPAMGKTWLSYASWCYDQARASISSPETSLQSNFVPSTLHPEVLPDRFQLTEQEVMRVEAIILKLFQRRTDLKGAVNVAEEQNIWSASDEHLKNEMSPRALVQQTVYLIQAAAGAPGVEKSDGDLPSAVLTSQLHISFLNTNMSLEKADIESSVNELVDIWWSLRKRRVSLFGHAAHGYLQFLTHASSRFHDSHSASYDLVSVKQNTGHCTLRATLYVLHILLNYGAELRDTLEPGLTAAPLLPWQEITPQIFARLSSHPEKVVRKQLEGLLMMLAKLSPWSIVYPTLVDVNACEGEPSKELQHIISCLGTLYPKLIQDVQLVINELGTVTVLWEEQWLSTLQDLHTDVIRRINMLKEEAARIAENVTLSYSEKNKINAAKYSAMMAPIVVALERRLASTSRKPETAHEMWFQKEYGVQLKSAIAAFKTPPLSAAALGDVWRPFDAIAASLVAYQRKSSVSLSDVAPQMALLSSSEVPMPGLEKQISTTDSTAGPTTDLQGIVTISSFCEQVTILSTKTRPKKLVIYGSDGKKYTYLLKGREDLRLDARIMQLLQAINGFLYSYADTWSRSIAIRYYSVTPISGRAGLIQWVDNVISIYSVFKSWQNRVQLAQLSAVGAGNMNNAVPPIPRPSDMFYGKIIPALKEKGIRRVISRRDWPHEVKRKVLLDLMKETPRQLLHQEIWCASRGFRDFSLKLKRFSGSVAAMSMVGHVLGLGDRHLDNILIDFQSGDVVHIDYNVCFDKGQRLKIPEIVPFRLTQTIEAALGLTGIEGTYRANCEAVVGVLRKNKDILLMLLEVFVWDPLVEWTRGDGHDEAAIGGEERKGMELAVSLSLFASRVQEIRVPLQEHHDLLLATLPATESALEKFLDVLSQYEVVSAMFYRADQERSNLLIRETSAKSIVAEATSNSEKTRTSFDVQAREFAQAKAAAAEKAQESAMWIEQHGRVIDALRSGSIPEVHACLKLSNMEEALSLTSAVMVAGVPLTIVPEPTLAQCHDLDREVFVLVAELDGGLSCALQALQAYASALQRILPLNYITTSPLHGWAQVLQLSVNNLSSDTLAIARRQAAEIVAKAQRDGFDSVRLRHEDLVLKIETYVAQIEKVKKECSELESSIGSETEAKSKDRLLSAFTKYMQSAGYSRKEDDGTKDIKVQGDVEEKKTKVLSVLHIASSAVYNEVKSKVLNILSNSSSRIGLVPGEDGLLPNSGISFSDFEEQIEKCVLVSSFVNELQQLIGLELPSTSTDTDNVKYSYGGNWSSIFQASMLSCRILISQMVEVVLPEIMRSIVSYNSEVMDAFGSLSQIRGSIDTALEQLVEVQVERASLAELEQNYFVKVGLITEQQLALEEAAVKGRDHLSWEEAEELATQEEACRAQLDQLHLTWNQKDKRTSSLIKKEVNLKNALLSAERRFSSLVSLEQGADLHVTRSKAVLATLVKPFLELDSIDQMLSSFGVYGSHSNGSSFNLGDVMASGFSLLDSIWKLSGLLNDHSFFIWKICIVDSFLDSCIHDISSFVDRNLGFNQLYNILKKKLETQLQEHVAQYLRERVAPALLVRLERECEHLNQVTEATEDYISDQVKRDAGAVKKVQRELEEYCDAHETVRAARSAVSLLKRQVAELTESLHKTSFEIVQMEWLHDLSLSYLHKNQVMFQKNLGDELSPVILNVNRPKLLESIKSTMSSIARSVEGLQACERTSLSAEGQLERAMGWACAGPSTSGTGNTSVRNSGIPPEFNDHLLRRRQLLWAAREQASDIIKICTSVLEFEASRDGLFHFPGDISAGRTTGDGRTWQQVYLNALTRLDVTFHSFTRAEHEWKLAQSSMEAAANALFSATNELCIASVKAKSASGDLQGILAAMRDLAYEASVALSAFCRVVRGHTALTSECGSMLEEVLAITEGLHDVYSLGKESATVHATLMEDLSKVNMILPPLESMLSTDVAALADAISRETESNMEISPIHGQALYQSYYLRLREACQSLKPLVPSVSYSVTELHAMLTRLARTASIHAGNLHKALEGLGESQIVRSQEISLSRSELEEVVLFDKENSLFSDGDRQGVNEITGVDEFSSHIEGWLSPPDSIYSSSRGSSMNSTVASWSDTSDSQSNLTEQHPDGVDVEEAVRNSNTVPFLNADIESSCAEKLESQCVEDKNGDDISDTLKHDLSKQLHDLSLSEARITNADVRHQMEKGIFEEMPSLVGRKEASISEQIKGHSGGNNDDPSYTDSLSHAARGKNLYALSVLRRVEMKLDGRDIEENRQMNISEQVDHLLKQATSLDNLCNMYEGWTPWI